ncbi:hypothetical protein [Sedimentitalea sp.]|uniref:hypothetical protein n=1 Tax=Sedimentitalea sp. TaxID=2048915 RepID=UPI0032981A63
MMLHEPRPAPRLPGVYIETVPPPRADTLPRMDVAAFVGFASSGPIDRPVPIEDLSRFRDIFGPDLLLARDTARDTDQFSLLGPAVEAFFSNGGRRAFVVRVADATEAATLDFQIPGLVSSADLSSPAVATARSAGHWPAQLATDTRLVRRSIFAPPGAGLVVSDASISLRLAARSRVPAPGDLVEATFEAEGLVALIAVDRVEGTTIIARDAEVFWRGRASVSPPASPPDQGAIGIDDVGLTVANPGDVASFLSSSPAISPSSLSLLTFDLVLWNGLRIAHRMNGLGFCARHPRYWADLPNDDAMFGEVFGRPTERRSAEEARFRTDASAPRFPLAGPSSAATDIWVPNAMKAVENQERARAPVVGAVDRLSAEGLSVFSDALFIDRRFARMTTQPLGPELEARYAMELEQRGAALRGMHALHPIDEVAMIAIPDATHRQWSQRLTTDGSLLTAPFLDVIPRRLDAFDRISLTWASVAGAQSYRLELSRDMVFSRASAITTTDTEGFFPWDDDCPAFVAARVRAERPGEIGPWSNVRASFVPEDSFEHCALTDPDLLSLNLTIVDSPGPRLVWAFETGAANPGDRFELQSGSAANLDDGALVDIEPTATDYTPGPILDGARYFRVRVLRGDETGPWSATTRIDPTGLSTFAVDAEGFYGTDPNPAASGQGQLTAIHRAMIRFAAARADMVALLSLPRHFRAHDLRGHLARLSPHINDIEGGDDDPMGSLLVPGLRLGEELALSYAALQHPWFSTVDGTTSDFQPPDGAVAGLIAHRANGPGVWIAAANLPIAGTTALSPRFDDATVAQMIAQQINALRCDPRGFLTFNAETLSTVYELTPLPVRLLMILLRRLALREGKTYVFEPHNADFRAQVHRRFERMLSHIHERGGFAGTTPSESFRVVTDESVNPPGDVDLGRFVTELRVAPSRPFRYLNVRLLRTGTEQLSVEEMA